VAQFQRDCEFFTLAIIPHVSTLFIFGWERQKIILKMPLQKGECIAENVPVHLNAQMKALGLFEIVIFLLKNFLYAYR